MSFVQTVNRRSPSFVALFLVLVAIMHIGLTTYHCHLLNAAAGAIGKQDGTNTTEVMLNGGVTIPRVLVRGVRVYTAGGEEPAVSMNFLASGNPPLLPFDIAQQFLLGGFLVLLAAGVHWLGRSGSRLLNALGLLAGAGGCLAGLMLLTLTFL